MKTLILSILLTFSVFRPAMAIQSDDEALHFEIGQSLLIELPENYQNWTLQKKYSYVEALAASSNQSPLYFKVNEFEAIKPYLELHMEIARGAGSSGGGNWVVRGDEYILADLFVEQPSDFDFSAITTTPIELSYALEYKVFEIQQLLENYFIEFNFQLRDNVNFYLTNRLPCQDSMPVDSSHQQVQFGCTKGNSVYLLEKVFNNEEIPVKEKALAIIHERLRGRSVNGDNDFLIAKFIKAVNFLIEKKKQQVDFNDRQVLTEGDKSYYFDLYESAKELGLTVPQGYFGIFMNGGGGDFSKISDFDSNECIGPECLVFLDNGFETRFRSKYEVEKSFIGIGTKLVATDSFIRTIRNSIILDHSIITSSFLDNATIVSSNINNCDLRSSQKQIQYSELKNVQTKGAVNIEGTMIRPLKKSTKIILHDRVILKNFGFMGPPLHGNSDNIDEVVMTIDSNVLLENFFMTTNRSIHFVGNVKFEGNDYGYYGRWFTLASRFVGSSSPIVIKNKKTFLRRATLE